MLPAFKDIFSGRWVYLWLVLPVLLLLPGLPDFAYPASDPRFSDMSLAHYPYAVLQRQAIFQEGRLRLWSPLILGGAPLSANPLAGLWYPPGWLAWLLPLPLAFNLLAALHLVWGGLGMLRLLRLEGLAPPAAVLGALAFEMMPKVFAHYGAGHVTLLFAVMWTPWLLVAATRLVFQESDRRVVAILAIVLAAICLADIRWLPFAGLAWLMYGFFLVPAQLGRNWSAFLMQPAGWFLPAVLAAMLSAILWLPLLEFVPLSTRSLLSAQENLAYSLPFQKLLGLLFPDLGGFHEWMVYAGSIIFLLALLSLTLVRREPRLWYWAILLAASLLFATLSQVQAFQFLGKLPGLSLLRAPGRVMFLAGLALAALAAHAVDHLLDGDQLHALPGFKRVMLGLCGFVLVLLAGTFVIIGKLPFEFLWGGSLLLAGSLWTWLRLQRRLGPSAWFAGLLAVFLLDLALVDRSLFIFRPAAEVLAEGAPVAAELSRTPTAFRTYSPSYSLPQQTAANYGLQLADGVDPLQLTDYVDFMETASGVPASGYSVALPPFRSGEPASDNAAYTPDPVLLGWLNVKYVLAEFDLQAPGLAALGQYGSTRVYENSQVLPRAWVQPEEVEIGLQARPVESLDWNPEWIEVEVIGPGLLVLSEIAYPGWLVQVDGVPGQLLRAGGLLRSVVLPAGAHQVRFRFQPASLYLGAAVSLAGLAITLFVGVRRSSASTRARHGI